MDIEGIQEVCDILGLLYRSPYSSTNGVNISIACPLAPYRHMDKSDTNLGCSVLASDNGPSYVQCHSASCGYHGSWYGMLQELVKYSNGRQDLIDLAAMVAKAEEVDLGYMFERTVAKPTSGRIRRIRCSDDRDVLPESEIAKYSFGSAQCASYLRARGVSQETSDAWGLCFDPRLSRVLFPVRRRDGALVGLTGRILPHVAARMDPEPVKYFNYRGLNKSKYLYGSHLLVRGAPVVVTEGPLDALRVWQAHHGGVGVVASLGKGFSRAHVDTVMSVRPTEIYVFSDNDAAGEEHAAVVCDALDGERLYRARVHGESVFPPSDAVAKDPAQMSDNSIRESLLHAESFVPSAVPAARYKRRGRNKSYGRERQRKD